LRQLQKEAVTVMKAARPSARTNIDSLLTNLGQRRLLREERAVTDPKFCKRFQILLVGTSHFVFFPTFNAETTLSGRARLDLYYKRGIHERRAMDPNESVGLQLFCHRRD
jgi:hypothetical protein